MTCVQFAPVAWIASIDPGLINSIDSEYNLPNAAIEWIVNAMMPANGPRPTLKDVSDHGEDRFPLLRGEFGVTFL
jgi:hypothetical protein